MAVFSNTLGMVDPSDPKEAIRKMANHIRQLQEELEYKLANLDGANFNETGLKEISQPVYAKIGDVEGQVTKLALDMDGLTIEVTNGSESSVVSLKSGNIVLSSGTIQLSGLVSFTDLEGNGTTTINGANIKTGSISADRISGGTLQGITIKSAQMQGTGGINITEGFIDIIDKYSRVCGSLNYDDTDDKVYLNATGVLGIHSGGNMAIVAQGGDLYLTANHVYVNNVEIGV